MLQSAFVPYLLSIAFTFLFQFRHRVSSNLPRLPPPSFLAGSGEIMGGRRTSRDTHRHTSIAIFNHNRTPSTDPFLWHRFGVRHFSHGFVFYYRAGSGVDVLLEFEVNPRRRVMGRSTKLGAEVIYFFLPLHYTPYVLCVCLFELSIHA